MQTIKDQIHRLCEKDECRFGVRQNCLPFGESFHKPLIDNGASCNSSCLMITVTESRTEDNDFILTEKIQHYI